MKRKKKTARTLFDDFATFAAYRESMEYFDGEPEFDKWEAMGVTTATAARLWAALKELK